MGDDKNIDFYVHVGFGSVLSIIIFLLGIEILLLFFKKNVSFGNLLMLLALILYVLNNVLLNQFDLKNNFNDFLENLAVFLTFGLTTVIFGILHFEDNLLILVVVFIYAVCMVLSLSRNKISHLSNSIGWPVALNGLFFPLIYYIYDFYLLDLGYAIFLLYYIVVSILY